MKTSLLVTLAASAVLAGCMTPTPATDRGEATYESIAQDRFLAHNAAAVDALVSGLQATNLGDAPILVATVVNINDLRVSAPLGRTLSEQYASQLVMRGLNVKELKLRGDVFVQEGTGELLLSREIKDIARSHSATMVLVGTYSTAANLTYISLKLVRTEDSRILRAHDYALPNDRDVKRLLQTR
ncbi:MAG TPA: FlgO family outer membrane protein [Rhodocyclaceae bacterium]|nr:FlgO family outer membrane protein [Rhodocyclaceae bacterium]